MLQWSILDRFRLIVNQVNLVSPERPLPKLPLARAIWIPEPNLKVPATTWILAGGSHHTALSCALNSQHLEDFAEMADLEYLLIMYGPPPDCKRLKLSEATVCVNVSGLLVENRSPGTR
jgi:L-arabinose isomerase